MFGDRERDGLAVGDRLAEGDPLVDVGDHVVEHRLRGADGERAPGDAGALHALRVDVAAALAEQRAGGQAHVLEHQPCRSRRRAGPSPVRARLKSPLARTRR